MVDFYHVCEHLSKLSDWRKNEEVWHAMDHRWWADCSDSSFPHLKQSLGEFLVVLHRAAFSRLSEVISGVHPETDSEDLISHLQSE